MADVAGPATPASPAHPGAPAAEPAVLSPIVQPKSTQPPDAQPAQRKIANHDESLGAFEGGFDSDGESHNVHEEGDPDIPALLEGDSSSDESDDDGPVTEPAGLSEINDKGAIAKMPVKVCNGHLQARGIDTSNLQSEANPGKKMLAKEKRLHLADHWGDPIVNAEIHAAAAGKGKADPKSKIRIAAGATWVALKPSVPVAEPELPEGFHAPSAEPGKESAPKMNYSETFERPAFSGKERVGRPSKKFLHLHGLSTTSRPVDWLRSLTPRRAIDRVAGAPAPMLTFEQITIWANEKAMLCNAGTEDGPCPSWKPLKIAEIEAYWGLLTLNGLSPSPQLAQKLRSQVDDPVNGNDLCHRIFSMHGEGCGGAAERYKQLRRFYAVQSPKLELPVRKGLPMHKAQPLLSQFEQTAMISWGLGETLSGGEQCQGFQGRHPDKLKVKLKNEGDGFLIDALCDDGFTYAFYWRSQLPPKKWADLGCSPLHARVLAMFESLTHEWHRIHFDNLHNSAIFCKLACQRCKVLVGGVARKGGRGLPSVVAQAEAKKKGKAKVQNVVKAAVLNGDDDCPNLIAAPAYDNKPVHFLSMIATRVKWMKVSKRVWHAAAMKVITIEFLRLSINDECNWGMGKVDISDQLRNQCRPDHWMRQVKWWWSPHFLALGWLHTNAYVMYDRNMTLEGEQEWLSHYELLRAIALALIDPDEHDGHPPRRNKAGNADKGKGTSKRKSKNQKEKEPKRVKVPSLTEDSIKRAGKIGRARLDARKDHTPKCVGERVSCQLHHLALGVQKKGFNVMLCVACNIRLCPQCYGVFHTDEGPKPAQQPGQSD